MVSSDSKLETSSHSGFPPSAVLAQMERILSSGTFIRSKRLGRFLRFTVEQYLEGHQGALKEYLVGVEVFNKHETFDPRIDSIVRVEARRLRSKLERYYQTEGKDDSLIIQFRKGSYVPQVLTREQLSLLGLVNGIERSETKSVAVTRFNNLGVDAVHSHFCTGLTEDIISVLMKVPRLRVVATRTHGSDETHSDYVLEGSVRTQGDRFRISAQLIDTSNHLYIWSETYERDVSDAFAVQDEISRAIVASLKYEFKVAA